MSEAPVTFQEVRARIAELKRELGVQRKLAWKLMPAHDRRRRIAMRAFLLLLPLQYVLAVGPSGWLVANGYLPDAVHIFLYTPLVWVAGDSDSFVYRIIDSWFQLWVQ